MSSYWTRPVTGKRIPKKPLKALNDEIPPSASSQLTAGTPVGRKRLFPSFDQISATLSSNQTKTSQAKRARVPQQLADPQPLVLENLSTSRPQEPLVLENLTTSRHQEPIQPPASLPLSRAIHPLPLQTPHPLPLQTPHPLPRYCRRLQIYHHSGFVINAISKVLMMRLAFSRKVASFARFVIWF